MIRIDCRGLSADEIVKSQRMEEAYACFSKNGYAILDHVLTLDQVDLLRSAFDRDHACRHEATDASLEVGDRRFMIPLPLADEFSEPLIYANPYVVALIRRLLAEDAVLEAFGAIVALAGAGSQDAHRDGPALFPSVISAFLPAHALTVAIPLVDMNELNGTTEIWPGSHRWKELDDKISPQQPTIPRGSCFMWDFRLFHRGTANRSTLPRPIIYATYAHSWYRDPINFKKKSLNRLVFDAKFKESIPLDSHQLLSRLF